MTVRPLAAAALAAALLLGAPAAGATATATSDAAGAGADAAAGTSTWSVQPSGEAGPGTRPHFTYDLDPGTGVSDVVGVTNHSADPLVLRLYASDAVNSAGGGFDLLPRAEQPSGVGTWIALSGGLLEVPARSRVDVPFTVTVPADARPGDHAGGIVATLESTSTRADGAQLAVEHRVGTRVYLRVTGPLAPAVAVPQLQTAYRGTVVPTAPGAVDVAYTVRNDGNTVVTGSLALETSGPFGLLRRQVELGELPELLPGNAFNATARVPDVWPLLRVDTRLVVAPRAEGATIPEIVRDADSWAVPWTLLTAAVVLVTGLVLWRHRRTARADVGAPDVGSGPADIGATPGEATPGEATPGEATPGEATPGEATPGEATPDVVVLPDDDRVVALPVDDPAGDPAEEPPGRAPSPKP